MTRLLFKHSVFSNRTLLPHLKTLMADPPDINQIKTAALAKQGSGMCSELHAALTDLRLRRESFGKSSSNTIPTGSHAATLQTFVLGDTVSLTLCCDLRGHRGSKTALATAGPRLLKYLAGPLDMPQACSLGAGPLFPPELHKGIVLKHRPCALGWSLAHSGAGGS